MAEKKPISNHLLSTLADGLLSVGCVKFGEFTLKSGQKSPIYIDLRRLVAFPELLKQVAAAYAEIMDGLDFDMLAALPYAAMPIGTAISLHGSWPMIYPRKEVKGYGTKVEVEGHKGNKTAASAVGKAIAEAALAAGIESVVFDRNGFKYHGRVKALAEAAREGGLNF